MRTALFATCVVALVMASGCGGLGGKTYHVKGKLTNAGKPPVPDPKCGITIVFLPLDPEAKKVTYTAAFNGDDNSFEVFAADGKGIPAGKYKVTLQMMCPSAPNEAKFNDKFSSANSPLEFDVKGDENLDIDVSKHLK